MEAINANLSLDRSVKVTAFAGLAHHDADTAAYDWWQGGGGDGSRCDGGGEWKPSELGALR